MNHIELLYQAYASDLGLVIETNDAERLRQKLYPLRKTHSDFAVLSFIISPLNGKDLWIVKQGGKTDEE